MKQEITMKDGTKTRVRPVRVRGLREKPSKLRVTLTRVVWMAILLGLVIEAQSLEHHWSKAGLQRDVDRYTKAARLGLVVLRFTWADVMFSPDDVRAAIADVVRWRTMQAAGRHGLVA